MNFIEKCLLHPHENVYGLALEMLPYFLSINDENELSDFYNKNLIQSLVHLLKNDATKNVS